MSTHYSLPTDIIIPDATSEKVGTACLKGAVDISPEDMADELLTLSVGILLFRISGEENVALVVNNNNNLSTTISPVFPSSLSTLKDALTYVKEKQLETSNTISSQPTATLCIFKEIVPDLLVPITKEDSPLRCVVTTISCYIEYDSTRISVEYANSILRTWTCILNSFKNSYTLLLDTLIKDVDYLDAVDKNIILNTFNNSIIYDYKKQYNIKKHEIPILLHHLFEKQASKYPKNIAIEGPYRTMTYQELNHQSNIVAHYLINNCNILPEDKIAILFPRTCDSYIAILGILKCGAAYVPLDISFPEERIKFTLKQANVQILLTSSVEGSNYDTNECVKNIDHCKSIVLKNVLDENLNPDVLNKKIYKKSPKVENISEFGCCYIIFTSGSTGRPKGVQIHHRAAVNLVLAEARVYKIKSNDRVLQGFSLAFDASVEEVWMAFNTAATLVVGTTETMKAGPDLPGILTKLNVTCFSTVPTLLNTIPSNELPTVRLIIVGGEACSRELANRWSTDINGKVDFFNTYGPTEATVICTVQRCQPKEREKRVTIGKPISNYRVYVVAPGTINLVPPGAVGELIIGGEGVSLLGYIGDKEKTEARFVIDPYVKTNVKDDDNNDAIVSKCKMYHSGDLVRFDPRTGELEFCGRMDQQVKIRGYRVELSEIESVILEVGANVIESAVVDIRGDRLVGFVVLRNTDDRVETKDNDDEANELLMLNIKTKLSKILASYMVPAVIHPVNEIPKLTSGKVVRSALKEPLTKATEGDTVADTTVVNTIKTTDSATVATITIVNTATNTAAAATAANTTATTPSSSEKVGGRLNNFSKEELIVCGIFEEQLGKNVIKSVNDSFFEMGGHSLLVSRAVTSLRAEVPSISSRDFYESKGIIKDLAKIIEEKNIKKNSIDTKKKLKEMALLHDVRRKPRTCIQLCCADIFQTITLWFVALFGLFHVYGVIALIVFIYSEANFLVMLTWFVALSYGLIVYSLLLAFLFKWILIGKYKAGVYPLWGQYHLRWWLVRQLLRASSGIMFTQTCFATLLYRCMGAKIGQNVFLGSASYLTSEFDLIEIGNGTTINEEAELKCHQVKDRVLILKKIVIGHDVTISSRSIVSGGAVVGDGAFLEPFTLVPEDFKIPAGEHWGGSPAIRVVSGCSDDAHEPKPNEIITTGDDENTGENDVVAELEDNLENKEEENGIEMVEKSKPNNTKSTNFIASNSATVVPIATTNTTSTQIRSATVLTTNNQRKRTKLFPCWIYSLQISIILFSSIISIVAYIPSLAILVSVLMETTPNSIPELGTCRATLYCGADMICVRIPNIATDRTGQLIYAESKEKQCINEINLEERASNVTAILEINQATQKCEPVNSNTECLFPFEHQSGIYTSCTLDQSPNMTTETIAWCKTVDGSWDNCKAPCDKGVITVDLPELFEADVYTSYSGLSFTSILITLLAANSTALLFTLLYVGIQIRILRYFENRIIYNENNENNNKDAENETFNIASCRFVLKWWIGKILKLGGSIAQPLQGTMMMPLWLRLMGANVGKNVEFSSTSVVELDTLTIDDGTFVADSVMLGMPTVSKATMRSRPVHIKKKAFIGNGAFVREGSVIAKDTLVALQTCSPRIINNENSTYLGSPPLSIEKREKALGQLSLTYNPSFCRKCCRLLFEIFGYLLYTLYGALFATSSLYIIDLFYGSFGERNIFLFVVSLPIVHLIMSSTLCVLIIVSKWIIMCGRFKAGTYPLFSFYVWRTELVERLEENLAEPLLLNMLDGTCWKVFYYRCMGAKIGRRPYLGHSIITEPDMISIGNDATIESGGTLQAHLFQDRMRLVKQVKLGDSCSVGSNSVVLLGGKLHNNVNLNPLSLNMRDEELPPRTEWTGSPATRTW